MEKLSACFIGHSARKMPYAEKRQSYEELEKVLTTQIKRLMWEGVSEFYVGGQTDVDILAAELVLRIRDDLFSTVYLHVVLPFRDIAMPFDTCSTIFNQASTITCLNEKYHPNCYRERNKHMVSQCNYLVAIGTEHKQRTMQTVIDHATKHSLKIIIINPVTFEVVYK